MGQLRIIAESKREIINPTSSRRGFTRINADQKGNHLGFVVGIATMGEWLCTQIVVYPRSSA
jgi:hypothetical protein